VGKLNKQKQDNTGLVLLGDNSKKRKEKKTQMFSLTCSPNQAACHSHAEQKGPLAWQLRAPGKRTMSLL
jgi:hypothetical protein